VVAANAAIPCDWDHESYCTVPGCHRPATHRRLDAMTADGLAIVVLICCFHAAAR